MLEIFVENELHSTFDADGITNSHPISLPVGHPDEINQLFDSISYGKGASIIRMMKHFLGEENFRTGVASYLNEFRYGNTVQDDLWRHLTKAASDSGMADVDVKEVGEVLKGIFVFILLFPDHGQLDTANGLSCDHRQAGLQQRNGANVSEEILAKRERVGFGEISEPVWLQVACSDYGRDEEHVGLWEDSAAGAFDDAVVEYE